MIWQGLKGEVPYPTNPSGADLQENRLSLQTVAGSGNWCDPYQKWDAPSGASLFLRETAQVALFAQPIAVLKRTVDSDEQLECGND